MATWVDGIAASENLDSSGERIIISGLDCSSLAIDGVLNWEHHNSTPDQIVGKILKAKKIFSEKDCEDDRQLYYWQKCQVPYLYVLGELFDDYKDSAKEVAGIFKYDADKKGQNQQNVLGFSIEGSKIDKKNMDITRSIARKVTCTILPCNKMAIAEMIPNKNNKSKDDLDSIFKTESNFEIELVKIQSNWHLLEMLKNADPDKHAKALGIQPMKKDIGLGLSSGGANALGGVAPIGTAVTASEKKIGKPMKKDQKMKKGALTAGSYNAAPGNLTGGAALMREPKQRPLGNVTVKDTAQKPKDPNHPFGKVIRKTEMQKSANLMRAEEEYSKWDKKEHFRSFMKKRLPKLAMSEIDAIGQTIALHKALKSEKVLSKFGGAGGGAGGAQNFQHSYVAKKEKNK